MPARFTPRLALLAFVAALALIAPGARASGPDAGAGPDPNAEAERLLGAMTDAVRRADAGGYSALLWTGDPVWLTEQRAWAHRASERPPPGFSIALASGAEVRALPDGSLAAEVERRWTGPCEREYTLRYEARFVRQRTPAGPLAYAGRRWLVAQGEGVRVRFAPEHMALALQAASVFPGVRVHVDACFGAEPAGTVVVTLYPDQHSLRASIEPMYADEIAGWHRPGESIRLDASALGSARALKAVLAHEYAHHATFALGELAMDAPWWMLEGVAEFAAARYTGTQAPAARLVRTLARTGGLAPWDAITRYEGLDSAHAPLAYFQGHDIVRYVDRTHGPKPRRRWISLAASGKPLDDATRRVLGMSFEQLDTAWRESLADR